MTIRALTSLLFIFIVTSFTFGQYIEKTKISKTDLANFKEAKLYVVLGLLYSGYDKEIKEAINDNWTYSKYEFIDKKEFQKLCQSGDDYFFLVPCQYDKSGGSPEMESFDRPDQHFVFLKIIKGNRRNYKYILGETHKFYPIGIASVLFKLAHGSRKLNSRLKKAKSSRFQDALTIDSEVDVSTLNLPLEKPVLSENKIIPVLVRNLQLQCNSLVSGKSNSPYRRQKEIYKSRIKIYDAPLYIMESDLSNELDSIQDVQKHFSGEVKLISKTEHYDVVKEKQDVNIVYSFFSWQYSYVRVFNIKSGEMIYLDRKNNAVRGIREYHLKNWETAKMRSTKNKPSL